MLYLLYSKFDKISFKKEGNDHESWRFQLETLLRHHTDEAEHFKEDGYSDVPFGAVSEDRPLGLPMGFREKITKSRPLDCGRLSFSRVEHRASDGAFVSLSNCMI